MGKQFINGENDDILDIVGRGYNNPNNFESLNNNEIIVNSNGLSEKLKQQIDANFGQYNNPEYFSNNSNNLEVYFFINMYFFFVEK